MSLLEEIRRKIDADEFEFSRHAVDQTILRRISVREVREVFANGEVIEPIRRTTTAPVARSMARRPTRGDGISNAAIRPGH